MARHVVPLMLPAPSGPPDTLVVVLHGSTRLSCQRTSQVRDVLTAVHDALPSADILAPLMPIEFWSLQDPNRTVCDVIRRIDDAWYARCTVGTPYRRVLLVGFSFGSVLLRQVFCRAAGARDDGSLDEAASSPWVGSVERMVLLAGLNRGWTVDSPVARWKSVVYHVSTGIGHLLRLTPAVFAIRRGAPFLTTTRLQWHALDLVGRTPPITVQLLGTRDDIVSPADNIDLATGKRFLYLEVSRSGHFDMVEMASGDEVGERRRTAFHLALAGDERDLRKEAVPGDQLLQLLPIDTDPTGITLFRTEHGCKVDDVVFVVHGIRDKGFWTKKIARVVTQYGKEQGRQVIAVAPTYGYFPLLPCIEATVPVDEIDVISESLIRDDVRVTVTQIVNVLGDR